MSSRIESGFVPLPKVEQEQPEDNIHILLNLPGYVDQDRIGVNLTGIANLCDLGGIRPLRVFGKTGEETSHVIPEIVGINSDGSAMASKKIAKVTVPTFEMRLRNSSWRNRWIAERWIRLNINMNVDEIGQRVSEQSGGVHSAKNWATELDRGFKTPIRTAGNQNLLHDLEFGDKIHLVGTGGYTILALLVSEIFRPDSRLFYAAGCVIINTVPSFIESRINPGYRFSLFPGFQVDRAIALGITSRTRNLIKDLNSEKK